MSSDKFQRWIPYAGLAVSLPIALVTGSRTTAYYVVVLACSTAAVGWVRWGSASTEEGARRPARAAVYYVGLLALIAVLVLVNPVFGFFGFTGYLHVVMLPDRAKPFAIAAVAALIATTQMGGVANIHGAGVFVYLCLALVNLLIAGVMSFAGLVEERRGRELAEANRRLQETLEENAGLHAQLVAQAREAGVLDERQRMAGEIHDTIAQGLTGIVRQLEVAERCDADADKRHHHMALARGLARESLAEARRSVQALRPGPLAEAHLPEALEGLARSWSETSGISARVEVSGTAITLPPAIEVVLFRAAQEALANAGMYSAASRAGVTLTYLPDVVMLDIVDDGKGFAPDEPTVPANGTGYGLAAMRSRLRQVGGTLTIESAPGEGTAISASVPTLSARS